MSDSIILVNNDDEEIGYGEKMQVHLKGQLHRAFSLFIVNEHHGSERHGEVLLQKRARNKYHSGGLWTNACCSHPRKDEFIEMSIRRRCFEELGLDISDSSAYGINEIGKFKYIKRINEYSEHEIDHVYVMEADESITLHPNTDEVEELKWIDLWDLGDWMLSEPDSFTAWFFAVYNMYFWQEVYDTTMIYLPIKHKLHILIRRKLEEINYVGPFI